MLGVSILRSACATDNVSLSAASFCGVQEFSNHPHKPKSQQDGHKRWQMSQEFKDGYKRQNADAQQKTKFLSNAGFISIFSFFNAGSMVPFILNETTINGMSKQKTAGDKQLPRYIDGGYLLPIQSMVVVTSPRGDHAPPAFAAITVMPTKNNRVSFKAIFFLNSETITMVVVRLSSRADRKNVMIGNDP